MNVRHHLAVSLIALTKIVSVLGHTNGVGIDVTQTSPSSIDFSVIFGTCVYRQTERQTKHLPHHEIRSLTDKD